MKRIIFNIATAVAITLTAISTGVVSASQSDRLDYLTRMSEAVRDTSKCEIGMVNVGNLYGAFTKLEKKSGIENDDRVLYYLICGDTIKQSNQQKYAELFGSLTTLQKLAPLNRSILAALKHPKVSCAALGTFGQELGNLSDTTRALICHACVKTEIPDSQGRLGRGMFEQTGDWKAIAGVCGSKSSSMKKICSNDYMNQTVDGDFKTSLAQVCGENGLRVGVR